MSFQPLDVVVLIHDLPSHHLRRGDVGAIVDIYGPDALAVECVAASGRTQALVTLKRSDVRASNDRDLLSARPVA